MGNNSTRRRNPSLHSGSNTAGRSLDQKLKKGDVQLSRFCTTPLLGYEKSLSVIKYLRQLIIHSNANSGSVYFKTGTLQILVSVEESYYENVITDFEEETLRNDNTIETSDKILFPICTGESLLIFGFLHTNENKGLSESIKFQESIRKIVAEFDMATRASILEKFSTIISAKKEELFRENENSRKLLNMTTHDLSSPLTAISGYLSLMNDCLKSDRKIDQLDDYHSKISKGVTYISNIINQLNDVIRLESSGEQLELVQVDLNWIAKEVCDLMAESASKKKHRLIFIPLDEPVFVKADITKLKRVIHNLIMNAIKYTPENGKIEVRLILKDTTVGISVKDNGIGIPEDRQKEIFEAYNQLDEYNHKESYIASFGLGLFISSYYCKMMNSEITVESAVGEGSEFVLVFNDYEQKISSNRQAS